MEADTCLEAEDADIHYARYAVYVDGKKVIEDRLTRKEETVNIDVPGKHVFRIIKVSESRDSSMALTRLEAKGGKLLPPAYEKRMKLEFIGDSYTCGYGVEGDLSQTYTTATENFSFSWGYKLAKALKAEYSAVCKSGAGVISGYTPDGIKNTENILSRHYDKMGCTMFSLDGRTFPDELNYDFTFSPDLIIILLGENDSSYCKPVNVSISEEESLKRCYEFVKEYKKLVAMVREHNPNSGIVCAIVCSGNSLHEEVEEAVEELTREGYENLMYLPISAFEGEENHGTDYHPNDKGQIKIANEILSHF